MKLHRNATDPSVDDVVRGLRTLLRRGAISPPAVLASDDLVATAFLAGRAESRPEAAVAVSAALHRVIRSSAEQVIATVLFGLEPSTSQAALGARRAAAAKEAGVTADSFRVRREPRLLHDIARALLVQLAPAPPSSRVRGGAHLEVVAGPVRSSIPLPAAGSQVVLGRAPDCDIEFRDDPRVSRHHASISYEGGRWVLRDLGSSNGTEGPDGMVRSPVELEDGDVFTIGRTRLTFRRDEVDPAATVAPEP